MPQGYVPAHVTVLCHQTEGEEGKITVNIYRAFCSKTCADMNLSNLTATPGGRCSYHPHFTDEETEAQRGDITCSRPQHRDRKALSLGPVFPCQPHVIRLLSSLGSKKGDPGNFPGSPVVKNLPSNAGDSGLIPGHRTEIAYAVGQLCPHATTREHETRETRVPQHRPSETKLF